MNYPPTNTVDLDTPVVPRPKNHAGALCITVIIGLLLTIGGTRHELNLANKADKHHFDLLSERVRAEIQSRLIIYRYGLEGTRNVFIASEGVTPEEFKAAINPHRLATDFPGALGIGVIARVRADEADRLDTHPLLKTAHPDLHVHPIKDADTPDWDGDKHVIMMLEPEERNQCAPGRDIAPDSRRRLAAELAMSTGKATITGILRLSQDHIGTPGFLYMLPIYAEGEPTDTPEQRTEACIGWVYMPMLAPAVFQGAASIADGEIDVDIFDGDTLKYNTLIFDNDGHLGDMTERHHIHLDDYAGRDLVNSVYANIGGRRWSIITSNTDNFDYASRSAAWIIAIAGTLLTFTIAMYVRVQMSAARRARAIASDMTADLRRLAEEANAATRAKSEFLANMSHEIRTPMTAILGYTEMLAEDGDLSLAPTARLQNINTIRRNGEHLLTLINDILDLSKIEAGKMTLEQIDTRLPTLIEEARSLMNIKARGNGLDMSIVYHTPVPDRIIVDPVRLRQILVNLVGNAIKFTNQGEVTLGVRYEDSTSTLEISVRDTGVGMSQQQIEKLFNAFEQGDTTMARRFGGTGLGLRISQRLAQLLGGSISVESTPGHGSTFTLSVCVIPHNDAVLVDPTSDANNALTTSTQGTAIATPADKPLGGIRILFVEDGLDNQRLIMHHLTKAGAEATLVENGRLAVEAMTTDNTIDGPLATPARFDLILTDMQMPEMDGYQSTRILRAKGCTLPIIAVTAHAMDGDAKSCIDAGCNRYLSKPIDQAKLILACRDAVVNTNRYAA